jgi:hypothetical protein
VTNVRAEAARLVESIPEPVRLELAATPAQAIEAHWELAVTAADTLAERGAGGWCDGMSITDAGIIMFRPTGNRRQNFTLLHELAHHLVDSDDDCINWIADRPESAKELEQICDQIAASILVPSDKLDSILVCKPPSAPLWQALYDTSAASWSACAVALAQRLPCDGFIAVVNLDTSTVMFSARSRATRPYAWAGDRIPAGHPLRQADPPALTVAWWPYPDRDRRQFYMSTIKARDHAYAVFAENDLWAVTRFHQPDQAREDRGYHGTVTCRNCRYSGPTRMWPCNDCGQPPCPRCKECGCDQREQAISRSMCKSCTVSVPYNQLVDGLCTGCRD